MLSLSKVGFILCDHITYTSFWFQYKHFHLLKWNFVMTYIQQSEYTNGILIV
jgi:hypothetical protein